MTREELQGIADILMENNIFVLSDEIYSELTYGRNHCSIAEIDGMKERTIMVNGFSKAFAMTGWRLGYLAAPEPIVSQALKIHQYAIMCSPTVSQYAAIEALKNCDREVRNMVSEYDKRRRLLVKSLNNIGLECFNPEGAFYVFPSIKVQGFLVRHSVSVCFMRKRLQLFPEMHLEKVERALSVFHMHTH